MKNQYLKDRFVGVEQEFKKAQEVSKNDPKIASMLSSYFVVFISGIFEDCVEHLFIERVSKIQDNEIENLVKELIAIQFRNPEYGNIKKLVSTLNPKYGENLRSKVNDKNIDGLNSIVTNKNQVAHGEISNATLQDIETYYENALKIFEELENILL